MSNSDFVFDTPPKMLYKFTSFEGALNILMGNKIYFAKLSQLNDPYEGMYGGMIFDLSTIEKREIFIENVKKKAIESGINWAIDKNQEQAIMNNPENINKFPDIMANEFLENFLGVCCLTDACQSLLMWAHYADSHTGCCLVFDFSKYLDQREEERFPFQHIKQITYQDSLPMHDMYRIWHYYAYKSCEWNYEHEWRVVMFEKNASQVYSSPFLVKESNGSGLYPLGDFLCGVILGNKMTPDDKETIMAVARQRGIFVQQASLELYKYRICLTEVKLENPTKWHRLKMMLIRMGWKCGLTIRRIRM